MNKFNQAKYKIQWILFDSYWSFSSVWLCWIFLPFQNTFSWHQFWWLSFYLVAYSLFPFSFILPFPFFNFLRFLFLLTLYILSVWPYPFQWLQLLSSCLLQNHLQFRTLLSIRHKYYLLDLSLWCSTGIINLHNHNWVQPLLNSQSAPLLYLLSDQMCQLLWSSQKSKHHNVLLGLLHFPSVAKTC